MTQQSSVDNANLPFILSGSVIQTQSATISQDAGRSTGALLTNTLMAKTAATGDYVPYTDVTATDGTAIPAGIYVGDDITQAAIVAGDVLINQILLLGDAATFDVAQLVLENSVALDDVIGTGVTLTTVGDELRKIGFISEATVLISETENA